MPTPPKTARPPRLPVAQPDASGGTGPLGVHPKVFRDELTAAADWVADYLGRITQHPVTRPIPPAHRQALAAAALPHEGQDLGALLEFVDRAIAPYPTGNGHPAFFAWINSPPSPAGVIAELLATAVNATCGMGEHALMDLERGVVRDLASLAGMAPTTGGVLTSGGSMANLLCLGAARTWFLRHHGATDGPAYDQAHARLIAYHSDQAHMSVAKAAAVIGLPAWRLRAVPTTAEHRMDVEALRAMADADRASGLLPFCVVSNLGSTASGAVDPIEAITQVCRTQGMWHHADGAWGGLGALVPELAPSTEASPTSTHSPSTRTRPCPYRSAAAPHSSPTPPGCATRSPSAPRTSTATRTGPGCPTTRSNSPGPAPGPSPSGPLCASSAAPA